MQENKKRYFKVLLEIIQENKKRYLILISFLENLFISRDKKLNNLSDY